MNAGRFVQMRVVHDFVFDRLRRVKAPDPLAAYGLLMELVFLAEWREPGRGAVKTTIDGLAEHYEMSHGRISRLLESLEAADLIHCEFVRGHEGSILVLAYDELVHFSQRRHRAEGSVTTSASERRSVTTPASERNHTNVGSNHTSVGGNHTSVGATSQDAGERVEGRKERENDRSLPVDRADLASRFASALRVNGNATKAEDLDREARAAVTRANAAGLSPDAIDAKIREVADRGAIWPSDLDKLVKAAVEATSSVVSSPACPDHGRDARCSFHPGTGWSHGAAT
jgi:hypothetical protein